MWDLRQPKKPLAFDEYSALRNRWNNLQEEVAQLDVSEVSETYEQNLQERSETLSELAFTSNNNNNNTLATGQKGSKTYAYTSLLLSKSENLLLASATNSCIYTYKTAALEIQ